MSTLLFMLGIIVGAVLAIFAYTKSNQTIKNSSRSSLDIGLSVLLVGVCTAVIFVTYFIIPGAFIGYVIGILLGVLVCVTSKKKSEAN